MYYSFISLIYVLAMPGQFTTSTPFVSTANEAIQNRLIERDAHENGQVFIDEAKVMQERMFLHSDDGMIYVIHFSYPRKSS